MEKEYKSNFKVQSVDRALMIIEFLKAEPQGLGITELANRLDVAKSTVHRIITSLRNNGYVRQNPETERYHLGLKLIELGTAVTESLEIRYLAKPYMESLVQETGETCHLVVLEGNEIVYIEKMESPNIIRMYSRIGKRAPAYCTGAGKAILSFLPKHQMEQIITQSELKPFTNKTITSRETLFEHLQEIKQQGYSIDDEEHELGIRCAAAPIFDHSGNVVAGISVAGPIMRMTSEKMDLCKQKITYYALQISARLGFQE